jgi:hypothetical protein
VHRTPLIAVLSLATVLTFTAAACAPGGAAAPSDAPTPALSGPPASMLADPTASPSASSAAGEPSAAATPEPTANPAATALAGRAWATAELIDVATGEPFTIADYAGRTIFVESMAIWCTNCRAQQGRFKEALAQLDPDSVAYVVLTVDPGETGKELERYREGQDFSGTYAVAGTDVARALVDEFGPNAINPPSVPLIRVTPDGEVTFGTGGESVDEIVSLAGG